MDRRTDLLLEELPGERGDGALLLDGAHVAVEAVDQGDAVGDGHRLDLLPREVVDVLHDPAQRVGVRDDHHGAARLEVGEDARLPEGQGPLLRRGGGVGMWLRIRG